MKIVCQTNHSKRTIQTFLIFPKKLENQWRWFETVRIIQYYEEGFLWRGKWVSYFWKS